MTRDLGGSGLKCPCSPSFAFLFPGRSRMRQHPELWTQATRGTRRLGVLAAVTVAALATVVVAVRAATPKANKPPMIQLDYEKYTLPNGLDVILRKDPRVPMVAVNV